MSSLKLTLNREPFELIFFGEKTEEHRLDNQRTRWMRSRSFHKNGTRKHCNFVEFTQGYGKQYPWIKVEFKGFYEVNQVYQKYSNGFTVDIGNQNAFVICLG